MCHLCYVGERGEQELKLRERCDPDDKVPSGVHKHLCEDCGLCWKHGDELKDGTVITEAEFKLAHTCPKCGRDVRLKHDTDAPPGARKLAKLLDEIFGDMLQ